MIIFSSRFLTGLKYSQARREVIDSHGTEEKRPMKYFEAYFEDEA